MWIETELRAVESTMGRPLVFALNGERVELAEVDPRTTLLQYIRSQPSLQGTKFACGEGSIQREETI